MPLIGVGSGLWGVPVSTSRFFALGSLRAGETLKPPRLANDATRRVADVEDVSPEGSPVIRISKRFGFHVMPGTSLTCLACVAVLLSWLAFVGACAVMVLVCKLATPEWLAPLEPSSRRWLVSGGLVRN